jgi:CheY-like chemotaxis protein
VVAAAGTPVVARPPAEPLRKPGRTTRDPGTVLVVDDDPTARALMERFLGREGYAVETASNGIEGLERAREIHPCAITLDVMMPDIDGWTVLAALKGDPALADIPVILVSIVDEKQRGYTLGATDYLVKPVDRERLAATLHAVCGRITGRVLLVDDDDTARALVRAAVERVGWEVVEAKNGRVALDRLKEGLPDAVVLELLMPEMDGFEFLAELQNHQAWRAIPVVVVTALDLTDHDQQRLTGEIESVILKNAHPREELLREVSAALATCVRRRRSRNLENA